MSTEFEIDHYIIPFAWERPKSVMSIFEELPWVKLQKT